MQGGNLKKNQWKLLPWPSLGWILYNRHQIDILNFHFTMRTWTLLILAVVAVIFCDIYFDFAYKITSHFHKFIYRYNRLFSPYGWLINTKDARVDGNITLLSHPVSCFFVREHIEAGLPRTLFCCLLWTAGIMVVASTTGLTHKYRQK